MACVAGDCADEKVIDSLLATARERRAALYDLVVINAGRGLNGSVMTSDMGEWDEMIRTNIVGCAKLLRASAKQMLDDMGAGQGPAARSTSRATS